MAISMAANSFIGMNCTLSLDDNENAHHYAACMVYKTLLLRLNGTATGFDCARTTAGPKPLKC